MQPGYDIIIAGGGMVGASLALALADSGLSIALIEAVSPTSDHQPSYDDRGLALSLSSQRIFAALGVWQQVEQNSNPIKNVHVSDRGHFGKVRMDASTMRLEAFGHVVIARELGMVLMEKMKGIDNVDVICPARVEAVEELVDEICLQLVTEESSAELTCKLLVVADGSQSSLREQLGINTVITDYEQTAIVTNVTVEKDHGDTAYERFTAFGPLAMLPLKQKCCAVVFTVPTDQADSYMQKDADIFLQDIEDRFGRRLGRLSKLGIRRSYPILQLQVEQQIAGRALLLGNSAHTIHPNGAQGFNLCLRDVAGLAEHLLQGHRQGIEPGNKFLLESYLASRIDDQKRVSRLSHDMTTWFYNRQLSKVALRNTAMTLMDLIPPVKTAMMRRGMGLGGKQPALVRGQEI